MTGSPPSDDLDLEVGDVIPAPVEDGAGDLGRNSLRRWTRRSDSTTSDGSSSRGHYGASRPLSKLRASAADALHAVAATEVGTSRTRPSFRPVGGRGSQDVDIGDIHRSTGRPDPRPIREMSTVPSSSSTDPVVFSELVFNDEVYVSALRRREARAKQQPRALRATVLGGRGSSCSWGGPGRNGRTCRILLPRWSAGVMPR